MSIRTEKVASVIKRILAEPIRGLAAEYIPGALVTLTSVRISKDLRIASIYISIYGKNASPGDFLTRLEDKKGMLKAAVNSGARLRFTPELRFFLDDTLDQMEHIQGLLDSVNDNNDPEE